MNRALTHLFSIACGFLASVQGHCDDEMSEDLWMEEEPALIADADEKKDSEKVFNTRIGKLETDMQKVLSQTAYDNFGAKLAPANPQLDGYGFFGTVDFLWWNLYEGGSDYMIKSKDSFASFPLRGSIRDCRFKWEPGFKIGAGYVFEEHDAWDANAEFTYFNTNARHSTSSDFLLPLVGNRTLESTHAKVHWSIHFRDLDLVLGKSFFVSSYASLRPFFGIASTWINQHRHFHFLTSINDHISLNGKSTFWGIGPRAGIHSHLFFSEHLSCYGNISGNLQWGDFTVREREKDTTAGFAFYNVHSGLHRIVPSVAFALGFCYETNFFDDLYHLMLKFGYENQYWWRQNQFPFFDFGINSFQRISEDLGMQGLTVEFRLDF